MVVLQASDRPKAMPVFGHAKNQDAIFRRENGLQHL